MITPNGWENFYVIVGSSAGALIGLQFVVLTLIAERQVSRMAETGAAFATPSVVHFGVVLFLSAIMSIPWNGFDVVAILWGVIGLSGMIYIAIVARRMRVQSIYRPVFEDWLFHILLPFGAYILMTFSAFITYADVRTALFMIAGAALLLLLAGIHNTWDAVTYHVFVRGNKTEK
jgi:hypothetical protein